MSRFPLFRLVRLWHALWCWIRCLFIDLKPRYRPEWWNWPSQPAPMDSRQFSNNCYNYACDQVTNDFAQPGYASGKLVVHGWIWNVPDCPRVTELAVSDGLRTRADGEQAAERCTHTVALAIDPDPDSRDYHWYRLDDNGMWSHKPGRMAVRNTDNSGNPISDPRTADRGPYTVFCGYFSVPRCEVRIDGWQK
jgi:hypothetical protein